MPRHENKELLVTRLLRADKPFNSWLGGWLIFAMLVFTVGLQPARASAAPDSPSSGSGAVAATAASGLKPVKPYTPARDDALARPASPAPAIHALVSQDNNDGTADDDGSDSGSVVVPLIERNDRPADWRLIRPDRRSANGFIRSKTRPPP